MHLLHHFEACLVPFLLCYAMTLKNVSYTGLETQERTMEFGGEEEFDDGVVTVGDAVVDHQEEEVAAFAKMRRSTSSSSSENEVNVKSVLVWSKLFRASYLRGWHWRWKPIAKGI